MKLSQMKQILAAGPIRLTKSLGQNFLHDGNQLRRIIKAADLAETDSVLEIGPGLGPLTDLLVGRAKEVLAIEKDQRLFDLLQQRFGEVRNLTLLHADALEFLRQTSRDWSEWKLVSNLPYAVASPLLVELAQSPQPPCLMVVTLQLEVARRLAAPAGAPDYGVLTLLVQWRYEPGGWFKIPASCFFPEPDVDSACVTLRRRPQLLLAAEQTGAFARLVKLSFSQRRKMMGKLLKQAWPEPALEAAFEEAGLDMKTRAETVSLEQFVQLAQLLPADA